ncbi:sigma-70 family RNA polymerase sigma factor [Chitinophaga agrisoli]|uniref:Sigma-70 family RNA polymerase sigma factor n=1 Tax=Chitinophaga agrisoli TaxID=2607653 RepID=A0A5B2VWI2_9BACT|nr:sigma-70 family RNA polymerase sigma factor [Chitinophaga agrisoli]KAA2242672.1 sigma-70 family RNA polymerase sigma factor [Chitinophaga agrisoli]
MHYDSHTEQELLCLLAQDSEYAFTIIFDHYRSKVWGTAMRLLKDPVMAEEIVQDIFMKLWARRRELAPVTHLQGFIATMTRNLVFDRFKKMVHENEYRKSLQRAEPVVDDTDHRVRSAMAHNILQRAIDRLPPRQKQVYEMLRIQGLSIDEVCAALSISRSTAKGHLTAALHAIRNHLNAYPDTFVCLIGLRLLIALFQ